MWLVIPANHKKHESTFLLHILLFAPFLSCVHASCSSHLCLSQPQPQVTRVWHAHALRKGVCSTHLLSQALSSIQTAPREPGQVHKSRAAQAVRLTILQVIPQSNTKHLWRCSASHQLSLTWSSCSLQALMGCFDNTPLLRALGSVQHRHCYSNNDSKGLPCSWTVFGGTDPVDQCKLTPAQLGSRGSISNGLVSSTAGRECTKYKEFANKTTHDTPQPLHCALIRAGKASFSLKFSIAAVIKYSLEYLGWKVGAVILQRIWGKHQTGSRFHQLLHLRTTVKSDSVTSAPSSHGYDTSREDFKLTEWLFPGWIFRQSQSAKYF